MAAKRRYRRTTHTDGVSLREYARHRRAKGLDGGTHNAVQQARDAGRIPPECFTKEGKIRDIEAADAAWKATTYANKVPPTGPKAPKRVNGTKIDGTSTWAARARLDLAKAELAEMELKRRQGELVKAADVDARLTGIFSACKTQILSVPSRMRQQDPSLTAEQIGLLESILREALEVLAAGSDDDAEEASA
jgi:phage terminase Nu1 subunit (DNA packaging protein)